MATERAAGSGARGIDPARPAAGTVGTSISPVRSVQPRLQPTPRILVVDDDSAIRSLLRETMEDAGFEVAEAASGDRGLQAYLAVRPDIVLLDAAMPGMDGFTVCSRLQELPGGAATPVLLITGLDDARSVDRAFASGATDFITKPLHLTVLEHRVVRLLQARRAEQRLAAQHRITRIIADAPTLEEAMPQIMQALCEMVDWSLATLWLVDAQSGCLRTVHTWEIEPGAGRLREVAVPRREAGPGEGLPGQVWDTGEPAWIAELAEERPASEVPDHGVGETVARSSMSFRSTCVFPIRHGRKVLAVMEFFSRDVRTPDPEVLEIMASIGMQIGQFMERRGAEEQLLRIALYDTLTGLPNRRLLLDRIGQALARVTRNPEPAFALLFLDLDRFKMINDSLGHLSGDQFLIEVAHRLRSSVRASDTVARLGGDEFVVVLDAIHNISDAERAAERIHDALRAPYCLNGHEIVTSASIGIALSNRGYGQPEDMLRDADLALYRAKSAGRSRHEIFDGAMHADAMVQLRLEAELRRAVERQEFELHYQPIVALGGTIIAVEALIRWRHPQRGLLTPGHFLDLAEETGLVVPMGDWVLRTACTQIVAWRQRTGGNVAVSVNLSARQFKQVGLDVRIAEILEESGLPPSALILELTESSIMSDVTGAAAIMGALRKQGIRVALDDFGTGYSSLSYLLRLPITELKVDSSFVRNVHDSPDAAAITAAIIAMARQLQLNVVGEGVETEAALDFLRAHHCDAAQGYCIAMPAPLESLAQHWSFAPLAPV